MSESATSTELIARAVIRRDGRLLLVRARGSTWSFLPGGHVEPGEPVETALVREIAEELGVPATVGALLGVVEHGYRDGEVTRHELNLVFEVTVAGAELASREDHLEAHWTPLDGLADVDVRPSTLRDALLGADAGRPFWRGWVR